MDIMKFLVNEGIIIAAVLYVLGVFIKKAPFIPDWLIPFILTALGIAGAGFFIPGGFTLVNIFQGIFAAGAAVLANQMQKQSVTRDVGDAFEARIDAKNPRPPEDDAGFGDDGGNL